MRPAQFGYVSPSTLDDVLRELAERGPDARVLAGGQSLIPMMSLRLARPEALVDVGRVPGLRGIAIEDGTAVIGAAVTHAEIEGSRPLAERLPVLRRAAGFIGHDAIRNRGTIGGSLAHADPAAEWSTVLRALHASVAVASRRGSRTITVSELLSGYYTTSLEPDEVITAVLVPLPEPGERLVFHEFSRQSGAFALVMVAARGRASGGVLETAEVVVGGCSSAPRLFRDELAKLCGAAPSAEALAEAAGRVARALEPSTDLHASAEDRRDIARSLVARALSDLVSERSGDG